MNLPALTLEHYAIAIMGALLLVVPGVVAIWVKQKGVTSEQIANALRTVNSFLTVAEPAARVTPTKLDDMVVELVKRVALEMGKAKVPRALAERVKNALLTKHLDPRDPRRLPGVTDADAILALSKPAKAFAPRLVR
jgi:hypothetical protein